MACICSDRLLPCLVPEARRTTLPFDAPLWVDTSLQYEMPTEAYSTIPGYDACHPSQRILHVVEQTDDQIDSRTAETHLIDILDELHTEFHIPEVRMMHSHLSTSTPSTSDECEQSLYEAQQPEKATSDHQRAIMEIYDWLHDVTDVTGDVGGCINDADVSATTNGLDYDSLTTTDTPSYYYTQCQTSYLESPVTSTPVKRKRGSHEMTHVSLLEYGMKRRRYEMTSSASPSTWHSRNY